MAAVKTRKAETGEVGKELAETARDGGESISLSECMKKLLALPVTEETMRQLAEGGFAEGEMNQGMLVAWALLKKAAEKGDVPAYREIKALMDYEESGSGQLERLLEGIREGIAFEKSRKRKKGPD